jgi:hypothetical protein
LFLQYRFPLKKDADRNVKILSSLLQNVVHAFDTVTKVVIHASLAMLVFYIESHLAPFGA